MPSISSAQKYHEAEGVTCTSRRVPRPAPPHYGHSVSLAVRCHLRTATKRYFRGHGVRRL
eukprot:COSAG05_NODE_459_length_9617_cov_12.484661_10_plen_60_part_00